MESRKWYEIVNVCSSDSWIAGFSSDISIAELTLFTIYVPKLPELIAKLNDKRREKYIFIF
jgi:hypothetical protein